MNRIAFVLLSALSLLVFSCKKDEQPSVLSSFHYGYYPIKEGSFWVYQVTEIIHDENAAISHDTISYQLKTEIGDTLLDNEGRIVNRFNRYKRSNPLAAWVLTDVWTTVVAENRAELVEENIRRVVLRFPVKTATIWDPNQFNFLPSAQAYYEYIHKPFTVGSIQSDSTVHVVSAKELTLVSYQNQYEVYAKQIGLVKKYYKDLQISNFDTLDVSQGKELYFSLLEYGH
jgi:hypothetical protein